MISVNGLNKFREFFLNYSDNYILIGGTACAIIFDEIGENFRATKDLDIVLIVENISNEFGYKLWEFIKSAGYNVEVSKEKRCFYRFSNPKNSDYPKMIELFSRNQNIPLLDDKHIIPIHISEEVSSMSAILLNDDYYQFMINGKRIIDGVSVLDEKYLIPFKAKAWCELVERKNQGEKGQSKHIKKHCKDIYNLISLLPISTRVQLSGMVLEDMMKFTNDILNSDLVPSDINIERMYNLLKKIYL